MSATAATLRGMTVQEIATAVLPLAGGLPLAIGVAAHGSRIGRRGESLRPHRWEAVCILTGAVLLSVYFAMLAPNMATQSRVTTVVSIVGAVASTAWFIHRVERDRHA